MQTQIIRQILILRPILLTAVVICVLFYLVSLLCLRKVNVKGSGNWLATFFVGLSDRSLLHMALALVKFAFYCALLLNGVSITPLIWLILAAMLVMTLILKINLNMLFTELVGGGLQAAGLLVCFYLQDYLRIIRHSVGIETAYWLLSAVLAVSALMVLLREMMVISTERNYFDELGEDE